MSESWWDSVAASEGSGFMEGGLQVIHARMYAGEGCTQDHDIEQAREPHAQEPQPAEHARARARQSVSFRLRLDF